MYLSGKADASVFLFLLLLSATIFSPALGKIQGDSPCFGDCAERDPELLKSIRELIGVVRTVQGSFKESEVEMKQFTQTLRDCEMCKSKRKDACNTYPPPCFPGVGCREHPNGDVQCGSCPAGYQGDGRRCVELTTCRERPCFPGVICHDTDTGFQCGPCPSGYRGNGQECEVSGTTEANTRPSVHRPSHQYEYSRRESSQHESSVSGSRPCDIYSIIHRNCTYGVMRMGHN